MLENVANRRNQYTLFMYILLDSRRLDCFLHKSTCTYVVADWIGGRRSKFIYSTCMYHLMFADWIVFCILSTSNMYLYILVNVFSMPCLSSVRQKSNNFVANHWNFQRTKKNKKIRIHNEETTAQWSCVGCFVCTVNSSRRVPIQYIRTI